MTDNPFAKGFKGERPVAKTASPPPSAPPPRPGAMERLGALVTAPGFYPDLHPDEYFSEPCPTPALTNSLIQMIAPDGAAMAKAAHHHPAIGQRAEDTAQTKALYMGSLVHRLALDKGDDYVISPYERYQSQEAKDWRDSIILSGRVPIKQKDLDEASIMADVLKARLKAYLGGFDYQTEVVVAWQEHVLLPDGETFAIWCRCMLDVWCDDLALGVDLKTCADASDDALQSRFWGSYAVQDCWYLRGINKASGRDGDARFGFLFVEKSPPYLHREGHSTESFRHGAKLDIERAMVKFATCLRDGVWPGYEPFEAMPTLWQLSRFSEMEEQENGNG